MKMSMMYLLLWLGCAPSALKMPGSTKMLGRPRLFIQVVASERQEKQSQNNNPIILGKGNKIAVSASSFLGKKSLKVDGTNFRYDCSGFVMAAHAAADISISGSTKMIYDISKKKSVLHLRKVPNIGEVAFFDNSHDRNKNGKRDDVLTHIAIVETIDADGTITLIHLGGSGIVRTYMNLFAPKTHKNADGKVINSFLRVANQKDKGARLTGELWRAFGSLYSIPTYELEG
jgi:surface antigen